MKKTFYNWHLYVSLFFLPMALMYALTGGLIILGVKDNIGMSIEQFEVPQVTGGEKEKHDFLLEFIKNNNLKMPKNITEIDREGGVSIGSIHYNIALYDNQKLSKVKEAKLPLNNADSSIVLVKTRSIIGDMILLHKDKGEWFFKIIGLGFALALIALYVTGLYIMGFKKKQKTVFIAVGLGFIVVVLLGYLSV